MANKDPQEADEPIASLPVNPEHRWADVSCAIRRALIATRQPALLWVNVRVDADGVALSGQVYTRREYELAGRIAERHGCGLPIANEVCIWAETTSRTNEA